MITPEIKVYSGDHSICGFNVNESFSLRASKKTGGPAVGLHCICGAEICGADDLFTWAEDGSLHARCRKTHCRLEKTLTMERVKDRAVVRFSKMFADYNMLLMGRDMLEKHLEELRRRLAKQLQEKANSG